LRSVLHTARHATEPPCGRIAEASRWAWRGPGPCDHKKIHQPMIHSVRGFRLTRRGQIIGLRVVRSTGAKGRPTAPAGGRGPSCCFHPFRRTDSCETP